MQFSYLQLIALAVLGNATGVFSRAIPTASQPLSQPAVSSISNPVTQDYPKQLFSENTDSWNNRENTNDEIAPVVDIDDDDTEANSSHPHQLESRALDIVANWDEYVEKGNRLYTAIGNAIRTNHEVDNKFPTFHKWGFDDKHSGTFPPAAGAVMHSDGIPSTESGAYQFVNVKGPKGQTEYSGFFPTKQRPIAMVETVAYKERDANLEMSEVAYQTAGRARDSGNTKDLRALEYIYKPLLTNPFTTSIMKQAYERSCEKKEGVVFGSDTDEFKALLGTPNGAIAARMLADHAKTFHKTVTEIRLYMQRNMMVLRLG